MMSRFIPDSGRVHFGTSGVRGLVTDLTDELCFRYVTAYLSYMRKNGAFKDSMEVALAADLRPSSPRIIQAAVSAINHQSGKPAFYGFVPTPALCLAAFAKRVPSLMVTGSHIPADRNGIKFNNLRTEFSKADEVGVLAQRGFVPDGLFYLNGELRARPDLPSTVDVTSAFISRYRDFFGRDALEGYTLGVYQHSSVARDLMVTLIESLGGKAIPFGRSDTFHAIDTEALQPNDQLLLKNWAQENRVNGIISTDGDADRPVLTDETGTFIRGDVLGLITAQYLGAAAVVTPITSSSAIEMSRAFHEVHRTKIGSPYVISALNNQTNLRGPAVGFEANGGFILSHALIQENRHLNALPTRDFALPMLSTLLAARDKNMSLSKYVATLPKRVVASDRLQNIASQKSETILAHVTAYPEKLTKFSNSVNENALQKIDQTDGVRLIFKSGDIAHLRPSGNAPELRLYAESETQERAAAIIYDLRRFISAQINDTE